jgi:hypothetical protein
MPDGKRVIAWLVFMLLLIQVGLPLLIPASWVYHYRVEYNMVKEHMATGLDRAIAQIAREVQANPSQEYLVLLGDSVTYSGPGAAEQSIGYYLEEWSRAQGRPVKVYTLAEPGMMPGDFYAVLLMLREHKIPLKKVAINSIMAHFAPHDPNEPYYGWLGEELRRRDPEAWVKAGGEAAPQPSWTKRFRESVLAPVTLWEYRDVIRYHIGLGATAEVSDLRPWTEKPFLKDLMRQPLYQRVVEPTPLDLTAANPTAYLWDKILTNLKGADVLVYTNPVNQGLMGEWVTNPGYQANIERIDTFFKGEPTRYVNWEKAMPDSLFADHLHLTPEGYRKLAALLGEQLLGPSRP